MAHDSTPGIVVEHHRSSSVKDLLFLGQFRRMARRDMVTGRQKKTVDDTGRLRRSWRKRISDCVTS